MNRISNVLEEAKKVSESMFFRDVISVDEPNYKQKALKRVEELLKKKYRVFCFHREEPERSVVLLYGYELTPAEAESIVRQDRGAVDRPVGLYNMQKATASI